MCDRTPARSLRRAPRRKPRDSGLTTQDPLRSGARTAHGGDRGDSMARVKVLRQWPDGDTLVVEIKVDDSFPDVVAEAKRAALDAYAEALGVTTATDEAGE